MRSKYRTPVGLGIERKRKALYADADVDDAGDQLKRLRVGDAEKGNRQNKEGEQQPVNGDQASEDDRMKVSDVSKDP